MGDFQQRKIMKRGNESEEDPMDEKGVVKRKSRNLSEKKRRDQFNILIGELCTMVCSGKRKMDKSTVLKTAIAFIRNHNQISAQLQGQEITEDWKPSFLSNEEFTHLILEALDGFILVFGVDGRILYASENITSLLGHLPNDLLGRSIYDFILADDKRSLVNILQHPDIGDNGSVSDADNPVTFSCHLRRGTKPHVYEVVHLTGYFRTHSGARSCSPANSGSAASRMDDGPLTYNDTGPGTVVFVASGRLQSPQLLSEKSLVDSKSEFTSRHSLEWKFLFLDHRAPPIIGYLPFEVLGTSGYDYYHVEDLEKVAAAHEQLMQKGEGTSCYYRFLTKGQQWIWIQTRYYISYHQWNSKPEFIVCTHRVVSYNEVIGRPVVVKTENPASCLSTGGRPRNSSDSRSSSRADREEGRAQLRSITRRTDTNRLRGPGRPSSQNEAKRPRSRGSSSDQPSYEALPLVARRQSESYPDSSYTPVPPLEPEDVHHRVEEQVNEYEFQQPSVPVVAYKSEPVVETPHFQSNPYQSSQSYRSSDRASVGSSESDPSHPPYSSPQFSHRQQPKQMYTRLQSDQMSTGSNESRQSDHRPTQRSYQSTVRQAASDAMSVGSSDSHHSVQSEPSGRARFNQGSRMLSPTYERQGRSMDNLAGVPVVVSAPSGFVAGYPVPPSQLVQIRQGSNLVTVTLPAGTVMTKNSTGGSVSHRSHEAGEPVEVHSGFQPGADRRSSQTTSQHVPVSFRSSVPMMVDMSGNTVPFQVPLVPLVQSEGQRVQIIDGVPMMTLPMVRGMPQPLVMTAAQKQLHEQLQQKHAQLQRQLLQQQEELRKVSEQLLFSQFGGWGPPVLKMAVQYDDGEPSGHSQSFQQRQNERDENGYRNAGPPVHNVFHSRSESDNLQYNQREIHMVMPELQDETALNQR